MRIWDLRKKMNDIKKQIHDLAFFFSQTQYVLGEKNV